MYPEKLVEDEVVATTFQLSVVTVPQHD